MVVFERKTGKILSGTNAPSAANLDKWLREHPGFEVVRSTTSNKVQEFKSHFTTISFQCLKSNISKSVFLKLLRLST